MKSLLLMLHFRFVVSGLQWYDMVVKRKSTVASVKMDRAPARPVIQHIVLMIQENRRINDFFATFPGSDGTTTGQEIGDMNCSPPIYGGSIALTKMPLVLLRI